MSLEVMGSGKVELFSADSLKKLEEVPFKNLITNKGLDWLKWFGRYEYTRPWRSTYYGSDTWTYQRYADYRPSHCFRELLLNNDPTPASSAERWRKETVAYANKDTYSGGNLLRGTPNYAESADAPGFVRWVFDWQTSNGNGTFQSIAWAYAEETSPWAPVCPYDIGRGRSFSSSSNDLYYAGYDATANKVLAISWGYNRIWDAPWGTGTGTLALVPRFDLPNVSLATGVACIGDEIYVGDYYNGGRICVYNRVTGAFLRYITAVSGMENGGKVLTTDGVNLFQAKEDSGYQVYKIDPAGAGTLLGTISLADIGLAAYRIRGLSFDIVHNELVIATYTPAYRLINVSGGGSDFGALKAIAATDSSWTIFSGFPDPAGGAGCWLPIYANGFYHFTDKNEIGARTVLDTPVTKTNLQTMKITYQFDYV